MNEISEASQEELNEQRELFHKFVMQHPSRFPDWGLMTTPESQGSEYVANSVQAAWLAWREAWLQTREKYVDKYSDRVSKAEKRLEESYKDYQDAVDRYRELVEFRNSEVVRLQKLWSILAFSLLGAALFVLSVIALLVWMKG